MDHVQQRFLVAAFAAALLTPSASAQRKFYDDDPLWRMPRPLDVGKIEERKLSEYYDFFATTFAKPGEKAKGREPIRARAINTLGEVADSNWYTNRHGRRRMSIEELVRGPGNSNSPVLPLTVTGAKTEGVTPGFTVKDAKGRRYQIKFDTKLNPELATGADVMGTKFFWALGYFTPQNYIVTFTPDQVRVGEGTRLIDYRGVERDMRQQDIERVLDVIPKMPDGHYRAVASLFLEGKPLGAFRYYGTRADDPNDIVPHEHRRDLRGLKVFSAWLNHTDTKSLNSLDMLVQDGGVNYIRHHLIDFSAAFGTDAFEPKSPRAGNVYLIDGPDATKQFLTLGLYMPKWIRADFDHVKGHGNIESEVFDPDKWKSHYYNSAFENCLPDDGFWAAKQIMRFTEPEIRALVETAQYSDKEAVDHLVKILIERQRKVGQEYFTQVLPLDEFRVEGGRLAYEDLAVRYGLGQRRNYTVTWSRFDNNTGRRDATAGSPGESMPGSAEGYYAAEIRAADQPNKNVVVYVRKRGGSASVVGVDRNW